MPTRRKRATKNDKGGRIGDFLKSVKKNLSPSDLRRKAARAGKPNQALKRRAL